jgi:hypothetical protein
MTWLGWILAAAGGAGAGAGAAADKADAPKFSFWVKKPADSATTVAAGADGPAILIRTESGIGQATITLTEGKWPRVLVVRFQYANGRPLEVIEGFGLETDKLTAHGGLRPGDKPARLRVRLKDAAGKLRPDEEREPLEIAVRRPDGFLELALPAGLLDGCKKLELSWIDAYRN